MHRSASCVILLMGVGILSAGPPASNPAGAVPDEAALPAPRAVPRPPTFGTIEEEPAPPPHEQSAIPASVLPSQPFREEIAPMPREQTPSPSRFQMPGAASGLSASDVGALHREIENLRLEREAMLAEEIDLVTAQDFRGEEKNTSTNLLRRITELLAKIAQREKQERVAASSPSPKKRTPAPTTRKPSTTPAVSASPSAPPQVAPPAQPAPPSASAKQPDHTANVVTDAPVDPLSLAQSLFRACDYTGALNVYRKLEREEQKPEERAALQYMMACCLRKLGKGDEAAMLYREVANSAAGEVLVENAQWYLRVMKDRHQLETELEELRQRRQAVMPRKP